MDVVATNRVRNKIHIGWKLDGRFFTGFSLIFYLWFVSFEVAVVYTEWPGATDVFVVGFRPPTGWLGDSVVFSFYNILPIHSRALIVNQDTL